MTDLQRPLEHGDLRVPRLGLGTWQLTGDDCVEAVLDALEIGYRHIDTAQGYDNESEVGDAIRRADLPREEIFVTSKVWRDHLEPEKVLSTTRRSLDRLGLDSIDLLLMHWPPVLDEDPSLEASLEAFERAHSDGMARAIGVSNFTPEQLKRALELAPVVNNQVEHHPFLGQQQLERLCRERNLFLTAYSPIARGRVEDDETLQSIGESHGKSASQVSLRWLLQKGWVAIPKASKAEHRRENFDIFDFALSDEEMERISSLDRGERLIDPDFAPDWAA